VRGAISKEKWRDSGEKTRETNSYIRSERKGQEKSFYDFPFCAHSRTRCKEKLCWQNTIIQVRESAGTLASNQSSHQRKLWMVESWQHVQTRTNSVL